MIIKLFKTKAQRFIKSLETIEDKIDITTYDVEKSEYQIKEQLLNLYTNKEVIEDNIKKYKDDDILEEFKETLSVVDETIDEVKNKLNEILDSKKYLQKNKEIIIAKIKCYQSMKNIYDDKLFPSKSLFDVKSLESKLAEIKENVNNMKFKTAAYRKLINDLK